ncbi:MAG: hypothetical protein J2P24_09185 [Streptosporangiales bacterium]|nr:hypothetical protein [Streptosporangiales bacterium]
MGASDLAYEPVGPPDRSALLRARVDHDDTAITKELLALAFGDPDWAWVQDQCLALITERSSSEQCRYIAVLCLGHLVTFHHEIDYDKVLPVLTSLREDPSPRVRERVEIFFEELAPIEPMLQYLPPTVLDNAEFERAQREHDVSALCRQLAAMWRRDPDWRRVEERCVDLVSYPHPEVRRVATVCLVHLTTSHRHSPYESILPALRRVREDDSLRDLLDEFADSFAANVDVDGYSPWIEPDRGEFGRALGSGDAGAAGVQLTALALEDPSRRWVQDVCLRLLHDRDARVRVIAVRSLENLVFFRGRLDRDEVVPVLRELHSDDALAEPLRDFFATLDEVDL